MKKLVAFLTAAIMIAAMTLPVMADNYGDATIGNTVDGTFTLIDKYLITDKDTPVQDVTFDYQISNTDEQASTVEKDSEGKITSATLEQAVAADKDAGTLKVYWGVNPTKVKIIGNYVEGGSGEGVNTDKKVSFSDSDTKYTLKNADDKIKAYLNETQQYCKKQIRLDFTEITFTEPGIYRYYFDEIVPTSSAYEFDVLSSLSTENKGLRTVDVYVLNKEESGKNNLDIRKELPYPYFYVVYEGHITNGPKATLTNYDPETNLYPDTGFAFGGSQENDATALSKQNWQYVDEKTGKTYSYQFDDEAGMWIETVTDSDGHTAEYYRDTYIATGQATTSSSFATDTSKLMATTYGEAVKMGASDTLLQDQDWEYIAADGVPVQFKYNSTEEKWDITGSKNDGTATAPADDAVADVTTYYGTTPKVVKNYRYADAVADGLTPAELQKYSWVHVFTRTSSNAKQTDTYTYVPADTSNPESKPYWKKVSLVENGEQSTVNENAYPIDANGDKIENGIEVDQISYEYASDQEKSAQITKDYRPSKLYAVNPNGAEPVDAVKNDMFVNRYETVKLTVTKNVTGNQGSRDQYFKFTITLDKAHSAGLVVTADKSKLDLVPTKNGATSYDAETMQTANSAGARVVDSSTTVYEYPFGADNKMSIDIYLQSGESLTLNNVPSKTTYTVTEDKADSDGYTTSATVQRSSFGLKDYYKDGKYMVYEQTGEDDEGNPVYGYTENKQEITIKEGDHTVTFTNHKNGVIPTGVAIGFGAAAGLVGIVIVYIVIRRRRYAYEDEE